MASSYLPRSSRNGIWGRLRRRGICVQQPASSRSSNSLSRRSPLAPQPSSSCPRSRSSPAPSYPDASRRPWRPSSLASSKFFVHDRKDVYGSWSTKGEVLFNSLHALVKNCIVFWLLCTLRLYLFSCSCVRPWLASRWTMARCFGLRSLMFEVVRALNCLTLQRIATNRA